MHKKSPVLGGTGQGGAPRAVQAWCSSSSKAATFGDDYLIKAPAPYFVKFLPKFFDKKYILAIFTPQKTYTRLFKRDGYSTTHAMYVWIFSCPTMTRGYETHFKVSIQTFFVKPGGKFFQKKSNGPVHDRPGQARYAAPERHPTGRSTHPVCSYLEDVRHVF